jgi:hypothetical protein
MSNGMQTQVNAQQSPAVEGDFASANPRFSVLAGPGGLVAGAAGVTVGRFAWATASPNDADGAAAVVNNFGAGPVTGLVAPRGMQALITQYLADASLVVPEGFEVALLSGGDVWVSNKDTNQANPGAQAYASFVDGTVTFTAATATASAWGIAAETCSATGGVQGNVLTATVGADLYPGAVLTSGAVGTIVSQLSGTPQGAGVYYLSVDDQNVAAGTSIGGTYGLLTLTTVTTGKFVTGALLTGGSTGVVAGTTITSGPITGTGGSGSTFAVNATQTSGNSGQGTLTGALNVVTKWYAQSSAPSGVLVKISSQPLG